MAIQATHGGPGGGGGGMGKGHTTQYTPQPATALLVEVAGLAAMKQAVMAALQVARAVRGITPTQMSPRLAPVLKLVTAWHYSVRNEVGIKMLKIIVGGVVLGNLVALNAVAYFGYEH